MPYTKRVVSLLTNLSPGQLHDFLKKHSAVLDHYQGEFLLAISNDHTALILFGHFNIFDTKQAIREHFDDLFDRLFGGTKAQYLYGIDDTVRVVCSNTALVILTQEREVALYQFSARNLFLQVDS